MRTRERLESKSSVSYLTHLNRILEDHPLAKCLFAIILIRISIAITWSLKQVISLAAFIFFYPAVFLIAWIAAAGTQREKKAAVEKDRAIHLRDDPMAVLSHDLKNSISVIDLNASLLMRCASTECKKEFLFARANTIKNSADRMLRLITDLLDVSQVEAGKIELKPSITTPEAVLQVSPGFHGRAGSPCHLQRGPHLSRSPLRQQTHCSRREPDFPGPFQ